MDQRADLVVAGAGQRGLQIAVGDVLDGFDGLAQPATQTRSDQQGQDDGHRHGHQRRADTPGQRPHDFLFRARCGRVGGLLVVFHHLVDGVAQCVGVLHPHRAAQILRTVRVAGTHAFAGLADSLVVGAGAGDGGLQHGALFARLHLRAIGLECFHQRGVERVERGLDLGRVLRWVGQQVPRLRTR